MQVNLAEHLPKNERIQLGSYYTPTELVHKVHEFIRPYLDNRGKDIVLFDSAGGCGAFLFDVKHYDYRIADRDLDACKFLKQHFNQHNVFHTNSLIEVNRGKYFLSSAAFLIMIGNPPYNDTTSEFKNGEKGRNICDEDLYDRDLGVSFLKSYYKLKADIICVLHPLSYLIKEANFKRLRAFKDNYKLIKGEMFSSALFHGTGIGKFPILVALYEKNPSGMTFEYIRQFQFDVLNSNKKFILSEYKTTDGYINKYPPRKNDIKDSPIGLYYYTFRDFNSLKKNTSFIIQKHPNGIVVTLENFYKYSYLYALKKLFSPEDPWLYGNLSPLVNIEDVEKNKKLYVSYSIKNNRIFDKTENAIKKIANFYKIKLDDERDINRIESKIKDKFKSLVLR
ncbi:MAG: Eco57I restriction-modification methylase domain-containing protein [Candidatus Omnitrophica bacterium]|nr:Eco57I restriction-modification methylase domain-containing protein [Candidatus Omnitrophota bacterium]